jgi:HEAT repeat protein
MSANLLLILSCVIVAALMLMGILTFLSNRVRTYNEHRLARLTAQLRPLFLKAIEEPNAGFVAITRARRKVVTALARSILPALRGEDRERVVDILEHEGIINISLAHAYARSPVRRANAAEVLGMSGAKRGVPQLKFLLVDPDADVRRTAARSLGLIGDPAAVTDLLRTLDRESVPLNTITMAILRIGAPAVGPLIDGCRDGGPRVRAVCAELLGLNGTMAAVPALTEALRGDDLLEVRIRAARALGKIGAPSSVDVLADVMRRDEPAPLRAVAARALGSIGGVRTISVLRDALDAPEHMVATNAAHALASGGASARDTLELAAKGAPCRRNEYAREALSMVRLSEPVLAGEGEA